MNPPTPDGSPDPSALLTVNVTRPSPGLVVVEARGEVDMSSSSLLHNDLSAAVRSAPGTLVVDLTSIDFFASSGIKTLMQLRRQCAAADIELRMVAPKAVHRVLEVVGLGSVFTLFDSQEEAIAGEGAG